MSSTETSGDQPGSSPPVLRIRISCGAPGITRPAVFAGQQGALALCLRGVLSPTSAHGPTRFPADPGKWTSDCGNVCAPGWSSTGDRVSSRACQALYATNAADTSQPAAAPSSQLGAGSTGPASDTARQPGLELSPAFCERATSLSPARGLRGWLHSSDH